jgi:hypothetical protein
MGIALTRHTRSVAGYTPIPPPSLVDLDWRGGDEFSFGALGALAHRLPVEAVEVGVPSGDGYFSATTGAAAAARLDEAFAQLEAAPAWIVLKDVQRVAVLADCVDGLFAAVLECLGVDPAAAVNRRCHIFVSSYGARTPLHADDCHGLLVQVSGRKEMVMYDMGRRHFSLRLARRSANAARVLTLPPGWTCAATRYTVSPGQGLTVPWNWPHEGATPAESESVSINVSFETEQTRRFAQMAETNELLLHLGRSPRAIGVNKRSDVTKALVGSAISRVGLLSRLERRRKIGDRGAR